MKSFISLATAALLIIVTSVIAASLPASAGSYGFEHHGGGGGWGHMAFGSVTMILFLAVIVFVVMIAVRWAGNTGQSETSSSATETALEILRNRYARGEIDKDEFEERKNLLSQ